MKHTLVVYLILVWTTPLYGQSLDSSLFEVTLESGALSGTSSRDTIDLLVEGNGREYAAFDFKIGSDSKNFEIMQVLKGAICDSCNWEFFNVKKLAAIETLDIAGMWQIVSLADMMPDSVQPGCYGWAGAGSVARVVIEKRREPITRTVIDSIFFIWEDCSDNTISERSGIVLAISLDTQSDSTNSSGSSPGRSFPNIEAAPSDCIKPDKADRVKRLIRLSRGEIRYWSDSLSR